MVYHGRLLILSPNVEYFFQNKETNTLIRTIVDVQPRLGGGGGGDTPDQIVWRICDQTRAAIAKSVDKSLVNPDLMVPDDMGQLHSLSTVLLHETDRFNALLALIHSSLNELQKAIKVNMNKSNLKAKFLSAAQI